MIFGELFSGIRQDEIQENRGAEGVKFLLQLYCDLMPSSV